MPQNNVLPDWRATYPNDAPVQKPPGVTVSTTATAPRVPNKPTYSAGTIQSYDSQLGRMLLKKIIEKPGVGPVVEEPKAEEEPKKPAPAPVEDEDEDKDEDEEDEGEEEASHSRGKPRRR